MSNIRTMAPRDLEAYDRWVKIIPAPELPPSNRVDGGLDIFDFRGF